VNREEIFGPVASTIRVNDYEEALQVANAGEFGLSAGIVTTSLKYARHFQRNVRAGMVMINLPTAGVDYHVPFGGTRRSSYGSREQGFAAVEFYTQGKTAYVWSSARPGLASVLSPLIRPALSGPGIYPVVADVDGFQHRRGGCLLVARLDGIHDRRVGVDRPLVIV